MILIYIWILFGVFHWLDYVINYAYRFCLVDYTLLPIVFILAGPVTTVRKIL